MTSKPPTSTPPPFDTALYCLQFLTAEQKIAVMKLCSLSLGDPRLYTETDVKVIVQGALDEQIRRARVADTMAHIQGKAN
jgi:hypothetical protein